MLKKTVKIGNNIEQFETAAKKKKKKNNNKKKKKEKRKGENVNDTVIGFYVFS